VSLRRDAARRRHLQTPSRTTTHGSTLASLRRCREFAIGTRDQRNQGHRRRPSSRRSPSTRPRRRYSDASARRMADTGRRIPDRVRARCIVRPIHRVANVTAIERSEPAIIDAMDSVAARRNRMQVRVYSSLTAHDQDDPRFWAALSVEERVLQVWQLSEAQWRLRGEFPDASGLPRSTARVHRP